MGWKETVYNSEGWKELLRTARNGHILHMPMEWMWHNSPTWGQAASFLRFLDHTIPSSHPLGTTALGEPWPPQQPFSIAFCLSSSPSTALSSLLILPRLIVGFRNKLFLRCGVVSPVPNSQPGGPGYPFSSGSSPLTCLAWEALPVASANASVALGFIWPHKPLHYVKVGIPSGGDHTVLHI